MQVLIWRSCAIFFKNWVSVTILANQTLCTVCIVAVVSHCPRLKLLRIHLWILLAGYGP